MQKIYIKGMVCNRCISFVRDELQTIGLQLEDINLGEVTISARTEIPDHGIIEEKLGPLGFSLLKDRRHKIVEEVKKLVRDIYSGDFDFPPQFRFALYISKNLHEDYSDISTAFSSVESTTLEKYIINYRIEKIKEFLVNTSETLSDISFRLGFSSVSHLSSQFKNVTGFNPSYFRSLKEEKTRVEDNSL